MKKDYDEVIESKYMKFYKQLIFNKRVPFIKLLMDYYSESFGFTYTKQGEGTSLSKSELSASFSAICKFVVDDDLTSFTPKKLATAIFRNFILMEDVAVLDIDFYGEMLGKDSKVLSVGRISADKREKMNLTLIHMLCQAVHYLKVESTKSKNMKGLAE